MGGTLAELLASRMLQDELHALLWIDPFDNEGQRDEGWSCRDHAAVVGAFLTLAGVPVTIMHGKCSFVQGPTSRGENPIGISTYPHTWLALEGFGVVDLSPNLSGTHDGWRALETRGVIGEAWLTDQETGFLWTVDADEYEHAIAIATHTTGSRQAAYLGQEFEEYAAHHAADSLGWVNSPLTDRLREQGAPADAYARFGLHLTGMLSGKREPLAALPTEAAWARMGVDGELGTAVNRIRERVGDRQSAGSP